MFTILDQKKLNKRAVFLGLIIVLFVYCNLLISNMGYFNCNQTELPNYTKGEEFFSVKGINTHLGDDGVGHPLRFFLLLKGWGFLNMGDLMMYEDRLGELEISPKHFIIPKYAFLSPMTRLLSLANPGYQGEAQLKSKENSIKNFRIKNNNIKAEVEILSSDRLLINQNYSKHWKSNWGKVENYKGRLSVYLDKQGAYTVELKFIPNDFYLGLAVSMITLLLSVIFLIKKDRCNLKGI